jgi:hypothetical protein
MIEFCCLSRLSDSVGKIFSSLVQYVGDADSGIQGSKVISVLKFFSSALIVVKQRSADERTSF